MLPKRRTLDPASALSPGLLSREAVQLGVLALLSLVALLVAPGWLRVVAGLLDAVLAVVSVVALVVAARVSRLRPALVLYAPAAVVFVVLALANFAS